jgi:hypothetical protein
MEAREFASEVQPEPVARHILAHLTAVEPLENVFARRTGNRMAGIADGQHHVIVFFSRGDADASAEAVVLARVLEQILHDQADVTPFTGDVQERRTIHLHLHVDLLGQRSEVIEPFIEQLAKIDRAELDLQPPSVHPREQQQIVDHSRDAIGLVQQRRQLVVDFRLEIVAQQQFLNAGAQDRDWRLQLM